MKYKRSLLIASIVALLALFAWYRLLPPGPEIAPEISVFTVDGEEIDLTGLRGRPLLVTFWATSCPSCIRELPHLAELYDELAPQGLELIGIAMYYDPPNRVIEVRKARAIPYPIALDIHAAAARAFGDVRLTPTSFLIAPDGRIVYRKTGAMNLGWVREKIMAMLATGHAQQHKPLTFVTANMQPLSTPATR